MQTAALPSLDNLRVGQGIDVHQLVEGRPLILGGVTIKHSHGLLGHSDADALLHAVIDAILGAAGKADIGTLFPNTDAAWKGASSLELLRRVMAQIHGEGWRVINVDCSILAEAPKMAPHLAAMKKNIGEVLGIAAERIGIKATTTETLGFVGRKEGITATAVVLILR
jgi:2-C-methyl-D-erythritol 2,4-cyclodiphosphate synthase